MRSGRMHCLCVIAGVLVFASVVHAETFNANQGIPGVDYPNYHSIPETSFTCSEQKYIPGFYADLETNCQAFHFCFKDGHESFLCPTGTTYNQAVLTCDHWYNSNCSLAPLFYEVNLGPALKDAGRSVPKLLKLRHSTQAKSVQSSTPNIFETLSALHSNAPIASDELENPDFDGDINEVFSDVDEVNETVLEGQANENIEEEFSEESLSDVEEEGVQGDAAVDDADTEGDYTFMGLGEESPDFVFDPQRDYYLNYEPYDSEWQVGGEPVNHAFRRFYDYGTPEESDETDEVAEEEEGFAFPEGLDEVSQEIGDEAEFSKRRSYRRRPAYVVVDDSDEESPEESEDYRGNESEDITEMPSAVSTEQMYLNEREEMLRQMNLPWRPAYDGEKELSEEFEHVVFNDLVERGMESEEMQQDETEPVMYENSPEQMEDNEAYIQEVSEDQSNVQEEGDSLDGYASTYNLASEGGKMIFSHDAESEESTQDAVIIPDEMDSISNYRDDGTVDARSFNQYVYEDESEQEGAEMQSDSGYGSYQDAYEYYKAHGQLPEGYEMVQSEYYQGPDYESSSEHYERGQYVPDEAYGEYGQYSPEQTYGTDGDYSSYTLEQLRQAYLSGQISAEEYRSILYHYQAQAFSDAESGYLGDDGNAYVEADETQDYASEASEYYSDTDDTFEKEMENELGVTDSPLLLDITEAANIDLDVISSVTEPPEESEEDLAHGQNLKKELNKDEETFYVFNFEENENKDDLNDEPSYDSSEITYADETSETDFMALDESNSNNITAGDYEEMPMELVENAETIQTDPFATLQSTKPSESESTSFNTKQTDNWQSLESQNIMKEKPLSSFSNMESIAGFNSPNLQGINSFSNMDFSSNDAAFLNSMGFPSESMDFGPYGFGPNFGNQYGMLDPNFGKAPDAFSHRDGSDEGTKKSSLPKLSALQERLRSMKQGKFGAFKKYMKGIKN